MKTVPTTLVCIGNLAIHETVQNGIRSGPAIGGDALFAALAARLYSVDVRLLAPVGNDLPPRVLTAVHAAGIEARDLPHRDLATVCCVVRYGSDGSRTWEMNSSEEDLDVLSIYPADVPESVLVADGVVLSAMSLRSQLVLTPWLRQHSTAKVYLDLREDYIEGNRKQLLNLITCCDVFMPSEVEAIALAQTRDLERAARFFASLGPNTVVIKLAERGSLVLSDKRITAVPVDPVQAVDSTGAGDAFCGAFAAMHLLHGDAVKAAEAGSRAARATVLGLGIDGLLAELVQEGIGAQQ